MTIELSVFLFQKPFHFCFYIVISLGLPDVASALETDKAYYGRPQV